MPTPSTEEPLIPRLLASNALRANLTKHMTLNKMADSKASMILTAASLVITITLTQYGKLPILTSLLLVGASLLAVIFSIVAIIPPLHVSDHTNLFYFRSFAELSEEEYKQRFKETIIDREKLYDAYLHEIYYLGTHRLTRKYELIRNGLWALLGGLLAATLSVIYYRLPL
ncbi:Pycsar system effector family protein [Malonomonas rubra]|uniref:Pycsar system effector family protein n=1 Tax=Malonomonas rubra TaxID=57040 RepID=UPI0026E97958|nr:Pycsar system effector family protein [Malonomonas rubra]